MKLELRMGMGNKKMLVYVGFSFQHHGKHSGYDQISKHLSYDARIDCQNSYNLFVRFLKQHHLLSKGYRRMFGSRLWWVEFRLILLSILHPNKYIFHITYGENIYKYLGKFKFKNKVALTLHQPPDYFEDAKRISFLKQLSKVDKLIVMSKEMEYYFRKKLPKQSVKYVPHGVDTEYYVPKRHSKKHSILMCGGWLRDFKFASRVFNLVREKDKSVTINVLTARRNHSFFRNNDVNLYADISDRELLHLYQEAKVLFLPLKRFTANNAMLEACSCGCQVIVATPQVFVGKDQGSPTMILELSENLAADRLIYVLSNYSPEMAQLNRSFVTKRFNWNKVAETTKKYLFDNN